MAIWQPLRKAKELWSWYSFVVGVPTLAVTGVSVAVGGTLWLIHNGIPLPLAMMAGYCTFVGAVYLTMVPLVFQFLTQVRPSKPDKKERLPNYEAWKHVDIITLTQASHLWCDVDPDLQDTLDTSAWLKALAAAWKNGELEVSYRQGSGNPPMVTRAALKAFAKKHGYNPRFLRDD